MQAVILAAGMGNRLRPLSEKIPKALVEVNQIPILFNSLNILADHGIKKATLVIGYLGDVIKEKVGNNWQGMAINYIENIEYDKTNNIYSLYLAKDVLAEDDTILMECDIFFEKNLISRLLSENLEDKVVVDVFKPGMDGTVVEIDKDGSITRLISGAEQGENFDFSNKFKTVNVYLFTRNFLQNYFLPSLELYINTQGKNRYYELVLSIFISLRNPILRAVIIDDVKWMEIDDYSDLKKAEIMFADAQARLSKAESAHGGYWRYNFLDFSYLYNLYFPPVNLLNEIRVNLSKLLTNYPSCQKELAKNLSNWVGIEAEYLTVSNGVSEIIRIINSFLVKKVAISVPTFNEYESGLKEDQIFRFNTVDNDFVLSLDVFADSIIKENCNVAVLINPNNPTGKFCRLESVCQFVDKLKGLDLIIIDESFIGFVGDNNQSMEKEFKKYNNVLVVRSLGKEMGILGARLGYSVSINEDVNRVLRQHLPIWNINSIAEYILEVLPKYRKEYKESIKRIIDDRDYLLNRLQEINYLRSLNSYGNYIFCIIDDSTTSEAIKTKLFVNNNILIKDCSNKTGLENKKYIRIAVRKKEEVDKLIESLKIY